MKKHLKRLAAPKSWKLRRKGIKFIARPMPGPHKLEESITLNVILKNLLSYAKTTREVKKILNDGKILVDKIVRKNYRFPVGVMDIIEIPSTNEYYILLHNKKGKFILKKISKEEADFKICKIIEKTILKKNKIQLNLYDGKNILVEKNDFKVGDSIVIVLPKNEIKKHLKFEKGASIYLIGGKHIGNTGILEEVHKFPGSQPAKIIFKSGKETFETLKKYTFVIEKEFEKWKKKIQWDKLELRKLL